jgi:hypothetical protein
MEFPHPLPIMDTLPYVATILGRANGRLIFPLPLFPTGDPHM